MERSPLYFNPDIGGLSPLQPPDTVSASVLPTLADQVVLQSNRLTLLDSTGNHLLVPVTEPLLNDLATDYVALQYNAYKVISFETDTTALDYGYKLADKDSYSTSEVLVGLCLGVVETTTGNAYVFQLSGKLTPLINTGGVTPPPVSFTLPSGATHGYVGNAGVIVTSYTSGKRMTAVRSLGTDVAVELADDGWEGGLSHNVLSASDPYLSLSGLTVTVADNTLVYFKEGAYVKLVNLLGASASVPDNSVRYLYAKPNGTIDVKSLAYLVVENESHTVTLAPTLIGATFSSNTAFRTSNLTYINTTTIRATTAGSWGQAKTVPLPASATVYYYEYQYAGGLNNAQAGIYLSTCTLSNHFFSASTGSVKAALHFSLNTTNNPLNNSSGEWTLHHTAPIGTLGTNARIQWLIDGANVYLGINSTWLNGGSPVATYTAQSLTGQLLVPVFSTASTTVMFTLLATGSYSAVTYPTKVTDGVKRSLATNRTYVVTNGVSSYESLVYLGTVNTTGDTTDDYTVGGQWDTAVTLSTSATTVTHNLQCEPVNVTLSLAKPANVTLTYVNANQFTLTASTNTAATVTVTNYATNQ